MTDPFIKEKENKFLALVELIAICVLIGLVIGMLLAIFVVNVLPGKHK